jgi:2',3'-cyclic-nucleotide 2'-phosphodiesterase (5'-nucleotidase family)
MSNLTKSLIILVFFSLTVYLEAKTLHIIHTNDLHSYFQGYRNGKGGYAKLMTKIQELKNESAQKGIEVLHLDGGDFGEGTSFFLSEEGATSLKALGLLGVDVSVIGNHDHMMGGSILGDQIRRANVETKFVSANLVQTSDMNLGDLVTPYVDIEKSGIKIRVIGLSTAEPHFQYPLKPGFILPPVPVGVALSKQARLQGKELVIALTHIGQKTDEKLARESSEFDLIVGGHSHDFLEEINWQRNKKGRFIPIVQAGSHGLAVGSLFLEIDEDGKISVGDYQLFTIPNETLENPVMHNLIEEAVENRNNYFEGRWEEVIGESWVNLSGYRNGSPVLTTSCWGKHMARLTKQAASSTLAIHLAAFEGEEIPAGIIRYGDMIDNFPHFRNYGDPGWEISTINLKGSILKILIPAIINLSDKFGVSFDGIKFKAFRIPSWVPYLGGKIIPYYLRLDGKKIEPNSFYTIAFPAEVAFALKESLPETTKKLFPSLKFTGRYYWSEMEDYIRVNSPIRCE